MGSSGQPEPVYSAGAAGRVANHTDRSESRRAAF
jgi:hypothetical protein